jgi:carbon storage regulator
MLVLSRKPREAILVGDNVWVTVLEVRGSVVRLGIEAPREVPVLRGELADEPPARDASPARIDKPRAKLEVSDAA